MPVIQLQDLQSVTWVQTSVIWVVLAVASYGIFGSTNFGIMGKLPSILFLCAFLAVCAKGIAQQEDRKFLDDFRGTASVTHNGISLVPSFSLGDPALLFDLKFTKGRFSFEPDMRFALEGKPWSMLFWFRYKAVQKERFSLRVGAHPALNFRTITIERSGMEEDILESRRFLAGEIAPNYAITKNISVGAYYLYSFGLDDSAKNNHFLVANSSFNNIGLTKNIHLSLSPQLYYLRQDERSGIYTVGFLTLAHKKSRFSISGVFNKAIDTEIAPEKDFIWSVLLNYSFP